MELVSFLVNMLCITQLRWGKCGITCGRWYRSGCRTWRQCRTSNPAHLALKKRWVTSIENREGTICLRHVIESINSRSNDKWIFDLILFNGSNTAPNMKPALWRTMHVNLFDEACNPTNCFDKHIWGNMSAMATVFFCFHRNNDFDFLFSWKPIIVWQHSLCILSW